MDKYINIVLTADRKYIAIILVVMTSVVLNMRGGTARFFIFSQDFGKIEQNLLNQFAARYGCVVVNVPMENHLHYFQNADLSTSPLQYLSLACYFRLLMFKILPNDVEKCFYIDGDMIVGTDLSQLYHDMPDDRLAAVCPEVSAMQCRHTVLGHCMEYPEFSLFQSDPYYAPYFNSGFFLLNVRMARDMNLFDRAIEFLARHPNPPYPDQDTLNAILGQMHRDKIMFLPPEWNVFCDMPFDWNFDDAWHPLELIRASFAHPLIYHYAGPNKPWRNRKCRNYYDVWWQYCMKSPCRGMPRPQ